MDETEQTIIDMINNSTDPTAALEIAIELALSLLKSLEASQYTVTSSLPA